jgi:type II secretory pathway pseudopilin PulG
MKQKKCFTLLELGIVIVVAIVVAVLIIFALFLGATRYAGNSAREKARQADCTHKLSMIGKAFFQYAMSYDDWYPTSTWRISAPKWMNGDSGASLDLLRSQDLLTYPKDFLCPSKEGIPVAMNGQNLRGHVSYNWCDGLQGADSTLSPVCADGTDNHASHGRFVRGDGSVDFAVGARSKTWTKDSKFKDFCYNKTFTDYSFK